ncbi:MAG: hypothetical protein QNJ46_13380 [Leptolyngbyaceae cyanobacterium MO_188.B28]|nr:hypothetical protein [Leptolyngbyaceae cyanobacterium MO_188.B28]
MITFALNNHFKIGLMASFSFLVAFALAPTAWAIERANLSAELGEVKAEFSAKAGEDCIEDPKLRIERQGETVLDTSVDDHVFDESIACQVIDLKAQDLDGDREPEIILDFYSGETHCCSTSLIYSYNPDRDRYRVINHYWGNGDYTLEDLNGDGIPEFNSRDDSFAYAFADYNASRFPPQIWRYQENKMHDITRDFPDRIYSHAYQLWIEYSLLRDKRRQGLSPEEVKVRPQIEQAVLAAYLANKYLLGQEEDGWGRLSQVYWWRDRNDFFSDLDRFLRRTGYIPEL